MSPTSVARAIQILDLVGLIKRLPTSGNRKSTCQLFDVKALAESHGAMRPRGSSHFELPEPTRERLEAQVRAIRQCQQAKPKARVLNSGKMNAEIVTLSGFQSHFSVSQRDATVSHLIRQRATRETQTESHLIQQEGRIEEGPTPTPTPSESGAAQKDKDSPDEDEPDPLQLATHAFIGVMNDLGDHLFDTSRPPAPHLANGAADWEAFGLNSLGVEAAAWRGEALELVLSASDPAAALRGLEKYRKNWEAALRKWYGCEVKIALVKAQRQGCCGC
jgi:hypothetical protein